MQYQHSTLGKSGNIILQNSMLGIACRILALESQQLKGFQLSKTVQKIVQFKQITHVSGGDYLHQVCEATKQDCEVLFKRTLDNK